MSSSEMSRADAKKALDDVARELRAECLLHPEYADRPKVRDAWARIGAAYMELEARADGTFRTGPTTGALPTFREDAKPDADVADDAPGAWVERHRNDWKGDGRKKSAEPDDDDEDEDDDADPERDDVKRAHDAMVAKAKNAWRPKKDETDPPNPTDLNGHTAPGADVRKNVTAEMADDVVEQAKAKALEKSKVRWKENPAHGPNDPYKGR